MRIAHEVALAGLGRPLRMRTSGRLSWEIRRTIASFEVPPVGPGTLWVAEKNTGLNVEIKLRHEDDVEFLDTEWETPGPLPWE